MSGSGKSNSSSSTNDNRAAADEQALAVTGTSGSQIARDGGISAGSKVVSGLDISSGGAVTVNITDGGAVNAALDMVREAGTSMQESYKGMIETKATGEGKLSSNQVTMLIIGAVATAIAAKAFKG